MCFQKVDLMFFFIVSAELTSTALKSLKNSIPLSVTFQPKGPGHYPCQIILKSAHDLRVYQLECTVTPEGSALELEFVSPTHQPVTQDIPVVNIISYLFIVFNRKVDSFNCLFIQCKSFIIVPSSQLPTSK